MSIFLKSPYEISIDLAAKVREKRLSLNMSQKTLAERSGVSYGTLKKFERSGKISLVSLLNIALVLGEIEKFDSLFLPKEIPLSIDEFLKENTRKRGRN